MQNTIVKEFAGHPSVVTAILDQGGSPGETLAWLQTYWSNYYLRGSVLFDNSGTVGNQYDQPNTGLPFGRGFIIDPDGNVDLPYFGHNPQMVIERIYELLGTSAVEDPNPLPAPALLRLQSSPNPFNPTTTIRYEVPAPGGSVSLEILDSRGRLVRSLVSELQAAGLQETIWNGQDQHGKLVASGVYCCRLQVLGQRATLKVTMVR
jgi:hypothetical protein